MLCLIDVRLAVVVGAINTQPYICQFLAVEML